MGKRIVRSVLVVQVLSVFSGCASSEPEIFISAQQSQAPVTQPLTAPGNSAGPPVAEPTREREEYYPGQNIEHWVAVVLERGARVKLEDGSLWEISPKDRTQTMFWMVAERIVVTEGVDRQFPHKLTNTTKGVSAEARLLPEDQ